MRELILKRIEQLINPGPDDWVPSPCVSQLFVKVNKWYTVERILAQGKYPEGFDFSTLNDGDLLLAFEGICMRAMKQWA